MQCCPILLLSMPGDAEDSKWDELLRSAPDKALSREWARRYGVGRKPKLQPCDWCGEPFSATDMRAHIPRCPARLAANPAEIEKAKALLAYMAKKPTKKTATKRSPGAKRSE